MDRYIGLDPHIASCTLAVVGPSGKQLKEMTVETNGAALTEAIRSIGGERHLCIEEGQYSEWLLEILQPHVSQCVVAQAQWQPGNKSDKRDAYYWAERLRLNDLQTVVYKAPQRFATLRAASRVYQMITRDVVRSKNRIKALYRSRGITGSTLYTPKERETCLQQLPLGLRSAMGILYDTLDGLVEHQAKAHEILLAEAKRYPIMRNLQTVPGIGPIRAALIMPVVITPHRFRTARQFWAYCGLAVVTRSSSDWVKNPEPAAKPFVRKVIQQTRGLNRNRQPLLKSIFKSAALTAIAGQNPLSLKYHQLLEAGTKPNLACLTIARKIAAITLRIWRDNTEYSPNYSTVS